MVETVVDPMLTHNTALNANALILMEVAEVEGILLHLLLQVLKNIYIPKVNRTSDIQNTCSIDTGGAGYLVELFTPSIAIVTQLKKLHHFSHWH